MEFVENHHLDALEIIKKEKTSKIEPKLTKEIIIQSPSILRQNQSEFSKNWRNSCKWIIFIRWKINIS